MEKKLLTVHEVSRISGVSIRTLHFYDKIGLLKPAVGGDGSYRYYSSENLARLQEILLFRELEFPLKEIGRILDAPNFDRRKALEQQIALLEMKRDHLDGLLAHARRLKAQEEWGMDFTIYDKSKMEGYKRLAKETWGHTEAYKEYEEKSAKQSDVEKRQAAEDLMDIFFEFGELMKNNREDSAPVQDQVKKLQDFITEKYYTCTDQILFGLGQMYSAGGDMTTNIDVAGGKGCANFVSRAIEIYLEK